MTSSAAAANHFTRRALSEIEADLDDRLAVASGLLGVALIEIASTELHVAEERLVDHLDAEDQTARIGHYYFVIVRCPLTGPAEMEGLGLRIADSFPPPSPTDDSIRHSVAYLGTVHVGVVTGRRGDSAQTLLRHVRYVLDDARTIGRPMVAVDDGPRILNRIR